MSSKTPSPPTAGERQGIAVLGGSFNPPHCTHQRLAAAAFAQLPISELRIVPAGTPPHKDVDLAPAADRLAMCRLAFADRPGIVVDDREVRRSGPSYTVDTLQELAKEAPDRALFFLIGSDNLRLLPTWRNHHRLLALCTIVTYPRAGHPVAASTLRGLDLTPAERDGLLAHVLHEPADGVAASDLRRRWRRGERNLPEIPAAVRSYIEAHALYG